MVGRDEELALITERLGGARPTPVVILGAAGVGKSRLLAEIRAAASASGMTVLAPVLATRAAASIPFGALADIVGESIEPLAGPQLVRAVSASLRDQGRGRAVVLLVDDAHLLDPGSAALILHLATTGDVAFVVTAVRSGEACPDAITALWKDFDALRLDLQSLSESDVARLLALALPEAPVDAGLARWVAVHGGGNPLYCRELVFAALAARSIEQVHGLWRRTGPAVLRPQLVELVQARLGVLTEAERAAMDLVVLAEPIDLDLLEQLAGPEPAASLERRQLVTVDEARPPRVRLGHPLYGDVLRHQMGQTRHRRCSRILAEAFEQRGDLDRRSLLHVATWHLDAGTAEPQMLTRAAEAASLLSDQALAVQLASHALRLGGAADAALALSRAETRRNRFGAADAALAPWEGRIGSTAQGKAYLAERVPLLRWALDLPDAAFALLARAETWFPDQSWQQILQAWTVELHQDSGQLAEAMRLGRDLLAQPGLEPEAKLLATFGTSIALLFTGRTGQATAVADDAFPLARRLAFELRNYAWATLATCAAVRIETGRDHSAFAQRAETVRHIALVSGDEELLGLVEMVLGRMALASGDLGLARLRLSECAGHLADCDPRQLLGAALAMLARVEAQCAHLDAARAALERAESVYPGLQRTHWTYRHEYAGARAWVAASADDLVGARRIALDAAENCGEFLLARINFVHDALRLGHPPDRLAGLLSGLAERTDAPLAHAMAAHAAAAAAGDGAALEGAAERFAGLGAYLLAAEAQSCAARTYRLHGQAESARHAATRAARLTAACPGARSVLMQPPRRSAMTRREDQVVRLAADGITNEQIAERLVVSVRTVESHLYHAFNKLGVRSRVELSTLIGQERRTPRVDLA